MADSKSFNTRLFGAAQEALDNNLEKGLIDVVFSTTSRSAPTIKKLNLDVSVVQDSFWEQAEIEKTRWNKHFPYQFLILKDNLPEDKSGNAPGKNQGSPYTQIAAFTLPIPPQELSIEVPYAISTAVTLGGIIEQHNGAPLRNITISGTTGVNPLKGSALSKGATTFSPETDSILTGTLQSTNSLATIANRFVNGGSVSAPDNILISEADFEGDAGKGTGYYQWFLLQNFLETYISLKKKSAGTIYRLAFAIWKQKEVYLVTPKAFRTQRSAGSPLEYMYNIQMQAYKRVTNIDGASASPFVFKSAALEPSRIQKIANSLSEARRVLVGATNLLSTVRADFVTSVMDPLRDAVFFCKDALNMATTVADLPVDIIQDLKEPILEFITLKESGKTTNQNLQQAGGRIELSVRQLKDAFANLAIDTGKDSTSAAKPKQYGNNKQTLSGAAPANKAIKDPNKNFDFFNGILLGDLKIRPSVARKIEKERERIRKLKRIDFEKQGDTIIDTINAFSQFIGHGSSEYNQTFGGIPQSQVKNASLDDWDILFNLQDIAQQMDYLAASYSIDFREENAIDYVAGLASASGIAFTVPVSKFAVPFPYGYTLEKLAALYLKDPNRWMEIATLNGLESPYVDEIGFEQPLVANGVDNKIAVADSSAYFVNQQVWLHSDLIRKESYRIQKIEIMSPTLSLITLNGNNDLYRFSTISNSKITAYKPNTVNSQQIIYIPSNVSFDEESFNGKAIPNVDYFDKLTQVGGVGLMVDSNNDIIFTPNGDNRLAVGLNNIIQFSRIALSTEQGSYLYHPSFGLGVPVGTNTADVSAKDLLLSAKQMFANDNRFSGVDSATIIKKGPTLSIAMSVGIRGMNQVIPITADIATPNLS